MAGRLIGKSGETVKKMRDATGAFIDIANTVRGATRRIITVKGAPDTIASALGFMADGKCCAPHRSAPPPRPRMFHASAHRSDRCPPPTALTAREGDKDGSPPPASAAGRSDGKSGEN